MSKYTVQLRWIIEQALADIGKSPIESNWKYVYSKVGLSEYPMYGATEAESQANRERLNNKIIRHYWMREIGFETAGAFKWYMNAAMQEIMPPYNLLYAAESTMPTTDPLDEYSEKSHMSRNIDYESTEDYDKVGTFNSNETVGKNEEWGNSRTAHGESESTDSNRNVFQDTPMSMLSEEGSPSIENLDYATTVTYDNGTSTSETDSTSSERGNRDEDETRTKSNTDRIDATTNTDRNTDETVSRDKSGKTMLDMELLKRYSDALLNIDMEIVRRLETLFFGMW